MTAASTLIVKRRFDFPPETVFDAWLDPSALGQWLFATPDGVMEQVAVDARVGGGFKIDERRGDVLAEHFGRYVEIDRPRRLAFDFGVGAVSEPTTRVTVDFAPIKGGCEVTLTHEGVWAGYEERTQQGWTMIFDSLSLILGNERERGITVSRVFDAPPELVWQAWATPEHFAQWMGPRGFTTTRPEGVFAVEGAWRYDMIAADGTIYPNRLVFREIRPPSRLVYDHGGGDETALPEFHVTVTFAPHEGGTRVSLRSLFPSKAARDFVVENYGAIEGGQQTLERLGETLAYQVQEPFIITRTFAAPRALVFDAFTQVEHLRHWWGPKGVTVTNPRSDLKPGGAFLYGMRTADGAQMWGKQIYREILPPARLVFVNMFTDEAGEMSRHPGAAQWPQQMLTTILFEEVGQQTRVTVLFAPLDATAEERATFDAGRDSMKGGWTGSFDKLDAHLSSIQA